MDRPPPPDPSHPMKTMRPGEMVPHDAVGRSGPSGMAGLQGGSDVGVARLMGSFSETWVLRAFEMGSVFPFGMKAVSAPAEFSGSAIAFPRELKQTSGLSSDFSDAIGLKRGASREAVERLREFLEQYGYLQHAFDTKEGFDVATEQALRDYQAFNGLTVTCILDEATIEDISRPRCGVPDIERFVTYGVRWETTSLTYGFSQFTAQLSEADVRAAIRRAFNTWSPETGLDV